MKVRFVAALLIGTVAGCVNPNAIGVTTFGTIVGRVYNAKTNAPIARASVSVGASCTATSAPDGAFTVGGTPGCVPVGSQDLHVQAEGFNGGATLTITVQVVAGSTTVSVPMNPTQ